MIPINMTKIYKKYSGLWVALDESRTKAFATGKTAKEVLQVSRKKGIKDPLIAKIPTKDIGYIL